MPSTDPSAEASRPSVAAKIWDVVWAQKNASKTDRVRFRLGWFGAGSALLTAALLWCYGVRIANGPTRPALYLLVAWTVIPPMYFWFDYFVLWQIERKSGTSQFANLEEFKHGQELSRNLWLAIVVLLAAACFKDV